MPRIKRSIAHGNSSSEEDQIRGGKARSSHVEREKMDRNQRKLKASSFPLMKAEWKSPYGKHLSKMGSTHSRRRVIASVRRS